MASVFDHLIGQEAVVAELIRAASNPAAMTHAWLLTGPPGSGRSIAALSFAAALQCDVKPGIGCGKCHSCSTVMSGTHADVRRIVPEGLSIGVAGVLQMVALAGRRPSVGRWQIVVVEDADRLTEQAANALLKAIEEPAAATIFLLCSPSDDPADIPLTVRSRCRVVTLRTPTPAAIEEVLITRDGVDPERARWAAAVSGGHVGRARRLATDETARAQRLQGLGLARAATKFATAFPAAAELVASAEAAAKAVSAERDATETEELKVALGAGGSGKGTAGALRGSAGALKDLERQQKSRSTRVGRDVLDLALVDLVALFRDALAASFGAPVAPNHPDLADQSAAMARYATPENLLRCIEAVLTARTALDDNVKPKFAVAALAAELTAVLAAA